MNTNKTSKCSENGCKFKIIQKYLFILFSVIIIFHFIFSNLGLLHSDPDSARYMLSTLVQSEAAVFAIVISLSLVAVQFAASTYSPRVIDIFKHNPEFQIVSLLYISIMIFSLGVLKQISNTNIADLEYLLLFSYYLGIFGFISLIPYTQNTLELLKPSKIVKKLAERITKQNFTVDSEDEKCQSNPILPVIDMVFSSWKRYDYDTLNRGLDEIGDRANSFLTDVTLTEKEKFKLIEIVCYHFFEMGILAILKEDDYFVQRIMVNLRIIAVDVMKMDNREFNKIASYIIHILYEIGKKAIKLKLEFSASWSADYTGDIGYDAIKQGQGQIAADSLRHLGLIGIAAIDNDLEETVIKSIQSLRQIGCGAAEELLAGAAETAAFQLGEIGKASEKKGYTELMARIKIDIGDIMQISEKNNLNSVLAQCKRSLESFECEPDQGK